MGCLRGRTTNSSKDGDDTGITSVYRMNRGGDPSNLYIHEAISFERTRQIDIRERKEVNDGCEGRQGSWTNDDSDQVGELHTGTTLQNIRWSLKMAMSEAF